MSKGKTVAVIVVLTLAGYITGYDNGQREKIVEIQNTLNEENMEWYHYKDVHNIVISKTIHGYE